MIRAQLQRDIQSYRIMHPSQIFFRESLAQQFFIDQVLLPLAIDHPYVAGLGAQRLLKYCLVVHVSSCDDHTVDIAIRAGLGDAGHR